MTLMFLYFFFFSSRRRHTRLVSDWSSDVCSSDLIEGVVLPCVHYSGPCKHAALRIEQARLGDRPRRAANLLRRQIDRRSEERRVGKECRSRWSADYLKKKNQNE